MLHFWAMANQESTWPEAKLFKPERFLDAEGKFQKSDSLAAFSTGKMLNHFNLFRFNSYCCHFCPQGGASVQVKLWPRRRFSRCCPTSCKSTASTWRKSTTGRRFRKARSVSRTLRHRSASSSAGSIASELPLFSLSFNSVGTVPSVGVFINRVAGRLDVL